MLDRNISAISTVAYMMWGAGAVLIALSFIGPPQIGFVGLFVAGAGGVIQIRGFFCAQQRREFSAFELGQDFARGTDAEVYPFTG